MAIQEYLSTKIEMQNCLLDYIDNDDNETETLFEKFIQYYEPQETPEDQSEFKSMLRLLSIISNYHKRTPGFFDKIERIVTFFRERIKQTFSNFEIFQFFQDNKRLLLFLLETELVVLDDKIVDIMKSLKYSNANYADYFEPEFNSFDGYSIELDDEDFYEKRRIGENDHKLCEIIRNDSIDEFVVQFNKNDFSLTTEISHSIYETNPFLYHKKLSIIEYVVFNGSIQIFQYLYLNNCELTSKLWLFAIHGKNAEIIHFLEDKKIQPAEYSYLQCLIEAMKCHHNEIHDYLNNVYVSLNKNRSFDDYCYIASKSIKFFNYATFSDKLDNFSVFYDLCQNDYFPLVKIYLNEVKMSINMLIISSIRILFIKFKKVMFFNRIYSTV